MKDIQHYDLTSHNTFGIKAYCRRYIEFEKESEVTPMICSLTEEDMPLLFMCDGVVQEQGTPEEVFGHPKNERLRSFLQSILK